MCFSRTFEDFHVLLSIFFTAVSLEGYDLVLWSIAKPGIVSFEAGIRLSDDNFKRESDDYQECDVVCSSVRCAPQAPELHLIVIELEHFYLVFWGSLSLSQSLSVNSEVEIRLCAGPFSRIAVCQQRIGISCSSIRRKPGIPKLLVLTVQLTRSSS